MLHRNQILTKVYHLDGGWIETYASEDIFDAALEAANRWGDEIDDVGTVTLTNTNGDEYVAIDQYGCVIRYAARCTTEQLRDVQAALTNRLTYPFRYIVVS